MPQIAAQAHTNDAKLLNLLRYNAILKIVQQTRAHGKGGIILVVPDNKSWMHSIKLPIKHTGGANFLDMDLRQVQPPSDNTNLDQILNIFEELNLPYQKDWIKAWLQVQQQVSRIARLTAVDGALVMNFDRYVYCFSAKIRAQNIKASFSNLQIVEPFERTGGETTPYSNLSGTRHQSAAQFAYDQSQARSPLPSRRTAMSPSLPAAIALTPSTPSSTRNLSCSMKDSAARCGTSFFFRNWGGLKKRSKKPVRTTSPPSSAG